ncbi:MAG TPA: DUF2889 domain-containing protein [Acidimicrobiales bacterium]|nr:DUF2889 domain-containing protein [Acidimicrobiales bacterium]
MTWPDGILEPMQLDGRCRDLLTPTTGAPRVLAQEEVLARASMDRTIQSVKAVPSTPGIDTLVGARAGQKLRAALEDVVPDLRAEGRPRYLLLDDLAGASLIAGFVWFRWSDQLPELTALRGRMPVRSMQGICSGFRPGASSLLADGTMSGIPHQVATVPPLADPADPLGWHDQPPRPPMAMRRARRIDVGHNGDELHIDAMFRDSCWEPDGTEIAVHEYHVTATADPATSTLTSVLAEPRVLPYDECPLAAGNVGALGGIALGELRGAVLDRLQGTDCCTHLNDALRALADVPVLADALTESSITS